MGACLGALEEIDAAIECFQTILTIDPNNTMAYSNLGNALRVVGKLEESLIACRRAIKLKPMYAEARNNLGCTLLELGKYEEAIEAFQQAIKIKPNFVFAYNNLGNALKEIDKKDAAIANYKKAIELYPSYTIAYNNLGNVLLDKNQYVEAISSYRRAISYQPNYAEAHYSLGTALSKVKKSKEAIESYNHAIDYNPLYTLAYVNLAHELMEIGMSQDALKFSQKALSIEANSIEANNNMGSIYHNMGDIERATQTYKHLLTIEPSHAIAHRSLVALKKYKIDNPHINELVRYHAIATEPEDQMQLSFALAKVYDDIGQYDKSFTYLQQANEIQDSIAQFDMDNIKNVFKTIKEYFSVETTAIANHSNIKKPIFILGMPRSGTTLVEQIISSHSQVYGAGELAYFIEIINNIFKKQEKNKHLISSNEDISFIQNKYIEFLDNLTFSENIFTDKMPHNFIYIGFILSAFPDAKIIHLQRDPRAVCWSLYKQYFHAEGLGYSSNLKNLAEFYNMHDDLMEFWHSKYPGKIYDISYEKLTKDQENESRNLLKYCDLDWEERCLDFHKKSNIVKTASKLQVRKKMYQGSSDVWRNYEQHLGELIENLDIKNNSY